MSGLVLLLTLALSVLGGVCIGILIADCVVDRCKGLRQERDYYQDKAGRFWKELQDSTDPEPDEWWKRGEKPPEYAE